MPGKSFSAEAKEALLSYPFPANIRELKAIVELACVMSDDDKIEAADLNLNVQQNIKNLLAKEKSLDEYNSDIINFLLQRYNNNVRLVADKLKIGKSTIYRFLKEKIQE